MHIFGILTVASLSSLVVGSTFSANSAFAAGFSLFSSSNVTLILPECRILEAIISSMILASVILIYGKWGKWGKWCQNSKRLCPSKATRSCLPSSWALLSLIILGMVRYSWSYDTQHESGQCLQAVKRSIMHASVMINPCEVILRLNEKPKANLSLCHSL